MSGKKDKLLRKKVKIMMNKHEIDPKTFKIRSKMAKKAVKMGILSICAMLIVSIAHADKIGIQTVNPKAFQAKLAEKGLKLDFNFTDKTSDSWGILAFDDKGMCINTYRSINTDDDTLNIITQAMWESMEVIDG